MKPYYLSNRNGVYYVRFPDENGKLGNKKSTKTGNKKEAERIANEWLSSNQVPKDGRRKEEINQKLEFKKLLEKLSSYEFSDNEFEEVQKLFKNREYIESYVPAKSESAEKFIDFVTRFWDYDNSPYIAEKHMYRHSIHRNYSNRNKNYVKVHIEPYFRDKSLGSITKQDIKGFMRYLTEKGLSSESINQITRCAVTPLKWAYNNELTKNNCFSGLTFVAVTHKPREVLTLEQASAVFNAEWTTEHSRLANLTAMCTGMRAGEIQALRMEDIGLDRLYVRHSWDRQQKVLKTPKNGDEREIPIPAELRDLLLKQAQSNPYNEGLKGFIFYGWKPGQPMDEKRWLMALRIVLRNLGFSNPDDITFHAWRHLYTARMADIIDERKLQRATGHKTTAMLEHYANHAKEQDFIELRNCADELFKPMIE